MGALAQARMVREVSFKSVALLLAASQHVYQGGIACGDTSTGTVKKGATSTTLVFLGEFQDTIDNSAGSSSVGCVVSLPKIVIARWYDNDLAGTPAVAANVFSDCYVLDDHTVTMVSTGASKAGRIWKVDSNLGVLVEQYTL
jgi:hypothetical protein